MNEPSNQSIQSHQSFNHHHHVSVLPRSTTVVQSHYSTWMKNRMNLSFYIYICLKLVTCTPTKLYAYQLLFLYSLILKYLQRRKVYESVCPIIQVTDADWRIYWQTATYMCWKFSIPAICHQASGYIASTGSKIIYPSNHHKEIIQSTNHHTLIPNWPMKEEYIMRLGIFYRGK